jgi:glycosyltransferase involved in cell wall biosynthesis
MAIVPSRWGEGFGLVALEAALAGRPVIATDFGGLPEVVIDGEVGLIVKTEDPSAISAAAVRLLDDPALAMRLGRAAAVRAREEFSLSTQLDNFAALYEKLGAARLTGHIHERPRP